MTAPVQFQYNMNSNGNGVSIFVNPMENLFNAESAYHNQIAFSTQHQIHNESVRRKMQRRQANRKSAQLSRARKKAHLDDLKAENEKFQRILDILESQPEIIFSFTKEGLITYLPERISASIKSAADDPYNDITQLSQILTPDSVDILMESLTEISNTESKSQATSNVREIYYNDCSGFPVSGFMRVTKVDRKPRRKFGDDDGDDESGEDNPGKKPKKESSIGDSSSYLKYHSGISTTSVSGVSKSGSGGSFSDEDLLRSCNYDNGNDAEEFVCVIRPSSVSSPYGLCNLHLLSAASIVAHDLKDKLHNHIDRTHKGSQSSEGSRSSGSGSSHKSSLTTEQTKNSTSSRSETGSTEDNAFMN